MSSDGVGVGFEVVGLGVGSTQTNQWIIFDLDQRILQAKRIHIAFQAKLKIIDGVNCFGIGWRSYSKDWLSWKY